MPSTCCGKRASVEDDLDVENAGALIKDLFGDAITDVQAQFIQQSSNLSRAALLMLADGNGNQDGVFPQDFPQKFKAVVEKCRAIGENLFEPDSEVLDALEAMH